jgi:hypothetical protein
MSIMKRKSVRIGLFLAIILLGIGGVLLLRPPDRVTRASWDKIRIGMTEKEVEAILGGAGISGAEFHDHMRVLEKKMGKYPFDYDGIVLGEQEVVKNLTMWGPAKTWFGRRGRMQIGFDDGGHVESKTYHGWRPAEPNFLDMLHDWLGW